MTARGGIRLWLKGAGVAALVLFVAQLSAIEAHAQRDLTDIPPPDPEVERESFELADGFEVNLFAADPQIAKPIQMNFDPQGRLWIVSSEVYPHIEPGQEANDRVLVVEDRDGDGTADKTTVFADGLLIPTGVEPGDGGAYVANSTELLHLKDTDGDGRADKRRIVLSGFGTEDTHHILHTLRWGPEGLLYFNQSIYIHSHIETPYGVKRLGGGGIWQFRPESMELDVFARGWVNAWGHHFDAYGQSFVTDGAGGEGINFVVPGAAYLTAVGVPRILSGLNPGSPKYCGLEIVGGRHLPDDWQGNAITNDFRGHRVCRFVLSPNGSGFAARQEQDLIRSDHVAFRPIDVKMGPDGAIYIADWYNPIIQHGEVDFRDPRRDHTHGRIWRVTYRGRPLVRRPELATASVGQLLASLKSPEGWTRHQAKRVLKERGKKVADELDAWIEALDAEDPLIERHKLEALWTYQALDDVRPQLLEDLLNSPDSQVRAAATRVVGHWQAELPKAGDLLAARVADENPLVRMEAVRSLSKIPAATSAVIAMRTLDRDVDDFLDYALWLTARELAPHWLPELQRGELDFDGRVDHLLFALKSLDSSAALPSLVALLENRNLSTEQTAELLDVVASLGGPDELRRVFDFAMDASTPDDRREALLQSLLKAARRRNVRPSGNLEAIANLLSRENTALQIVAMQLAGHWKLEALRDELVTIARDGSADADVRGAAFDGLATLGGGDSVQFFQTLLVDAEVDERLRMRAALSLTEIDPGTAAPQIADFLSSIDNPAVAERLFQAFLQHKQGPKLLAASLGDRELNADVGKIGLRMIESSGRDEPELTAALKKAARITGGPKVLTSDQMQNLIAEVQQQGDPHQGEKIFRRADLLCQQCHAIGGAGGQVGPDLISLGGSAQVDYLIESLLEPNKAVKENYHTVVVVTDEGKVHTGVKLRQTDTDLILRDAEDREIRVPLDSIDEQAPGSSIMPTGLAEKLTETELVDLIRFLSELGRTPEFSVGPDPAVRRWRVLGATPEAVHRLRRTSYDMAAVDDRAFQWSPAYSNVDGTLPLSELPELHFRKAFDEGTRGMAFVRFELDASQPGRCVLQFNSVEGLQMWLGTAPVELNDATELELTRGVHRVTLAIDLSQRPDDLRIGIERASESPGEVKAVSGK